MDRKTAIAIQKTAAADASAGAAAAAGVARDRKKEVAAAAAVAALSGGMDSTAAAEGGLKVAFWGGGGKSGSKGGGGSKGERGGGGAGEPAKPKKGMSSYLAFANKERDRMRKQNPGMAMPDITAALGREWNGLPKVDRKPFEKIAAKDKARHEAEKAVYLTKLAAWQASDAGLAHAAGRRRRFSSISVSIR